MVKSELVKKILKLYPELTLYKAEKIVNIFFEQIAQALLEGQTAELRQFGTFYIRNKKPRKARNPTTKKIIEIEAKKLPYFRASPLLIKLLNAHKDAH